MAKELLRVRLPIEAAKLRLMIELLEPSHHAVLRYAGSGRLLLEEPAVDGTFSNDDAGQSMTLQDGDTGERENVALADPGIVRPDTLSEGRRLLEADARASSAEPLSGSKGKRP